MFEGQRKPAREACLWAVGENEWVKFSVHQQGCKLGNQRASQIMAEEEKTETLKWTCQIESPV